MNKNQKESTNSKNFIAKYLVTNNLWHNFNGGILLLDVPSPPSRLRASDVMDETVDLEWLPPDFTGNLPLTGYVVERRDADRMQWQRIGNTGPDVTKFEALNLLEGRMYMFRVMAENAEGLSEPAMLPRPIMPERPVGECQFQYLFDWIFIAFWQRSLVN